MSKFYLCKMCGNIVEKVEDSGLAPFCCGKKMTYLDPGEAEGAFEKHLPVVTVTKLSCDTAGDAKALHIHIEVGSELHPTLNNHYIKWVQLETDKGIYRHYLKSGTAPKVDFVICGCEKLLHAYAYCNQHGLWACSKFE